MRTSVKKFIGILSIVGFSIFSTGAWAQEGSSATGAFIEPSLFYESGTAYFSTANNIINFSGKLEGVGIGARGGMHVWDIAFAGLDLMYSTPTFTDAQGRYSSNTKSLLVGVFGGAQMPIVGLRVWASYFPFGSLDQDRNRGLQMKFSSPSIYKLGAGFRLLLVSLNLEYMWGTYGKSEIQNDGSTFATFTDATAKREGFLLSVSFPLSF